MKKFLCFLLCLVFGLSLASCDNSKTFTKEGVTITLENGWREFESPYAAVAYQSNKAAFSVNKENPKDYVGYSFFSDKEHPSKYGDLILSFNNAKLDGNDAPACVDEKTNNGSYFAYSTYDNVVNEISFRYMLVVMYGENTLYLMNFCCANSEFDGLKNTFISYSKTIVVE